MTHARGMQAVLELNINVIPLILHRTHIRQPKFKKYQIDILRYMEWRIKISKHVGVSWVV